MIALLPVLGFAIFYCGDSNCSKKQQTRLLLDWEPNPNHIPLYVGIEKGIFADHGIDLKVMRLYDLTNPLPVLNKGHADIALINPPRALLAAEQGKVFRVFGTLIAAPLHAFVFRRDSYIQSVDDFDGKVIASWESPIGTCLLKRLHQERGIHYKLDRNAPSNIISPLGTKSVDIVYGAYWNIDPVQLTDFGVDTSYFKVSELGVPDYDEIVLVGRDAFLKSQPDFCDAFLAALDESIHLCRESPEEAFLCYAHANPEKSRKTLLWERRSWNQTVPLLPLHPEVNEERWVNLYSWMHEKNIAHGDVDFEELFYTSHE